MCTYSVLGTYRITIDMARPRLPSGLICYTTMEKGSGDAVIYEIHTAKRQEFSLKYLLLNFIQRNHR